MKKALIDLFNDVERRNRLFYSIFLSTVLGISIFFTYQTVILNSKAHTLDTHGKALDDKLTQTLSSMKQTQKELEILKSQDQYKSNKDLEKTISAIESSYKKSVTVYESLIKFRESSTKTSKFDEAYVSALELLSKRNYASAEATLNKLSADISAQQTQVSSTFSIPQNIVANNVPPSSGYRRQKVSADIGDYLVDIVSADLNSTRVVVDTASDGDCGNDCPVLSLADYTTRSGGFAGINGPYFCPASYPSCDGKKNSFDTLIMNKAKHYFNSDNNVYSSVPAVIFSGSSARFVGQSSQWGRDTGVDSVITSQPLLVLDGNIVFNGDGEPKRGSKGSRSFIGATGSTVYIGVVQNATVAEVAHVLKALGVQNALNLDSGASTSLWSGGYIIPQGRATPFGIILQHK
ncbi:hypothetical protein A3D80_00600 [Candidatus Roizmanbacteria bacterium RIFCSPHIGHO2_02_FULL_40_13b]|uniref:Phosphodiester glycosidase domain-containing protein n=1 Tax=Candidatus Roizmanbacteria bacterium RIFCSPHIGHO2_01_FULL_39_24 TaxID=1802032 RepID=A0A1F7GKE7_9BACT|nr:MAG: hypothetical protein A2799_02565 [Candidatus Roizmanbacteria bacterium RIFCSPHIGHO2_01_FULL_39_24]OGK27446.1 MAG: hypothetical protein A3D80_00600 [Candidatus Roizmanbacteria bacterium RIFCSPHIGHO2_02_FULL_40_13b]OGK50003.1 MAG: hypothetical protein A3A56_00900 [Candidatus Roizmanbacteria bacterium RIFCSPLOWO2_01_FULL_40_32]